MRRALIGLAAVTLAAAGLVRGGETNAPGAALQAADRGQATVPDRELGLRKTALGDDRAPEPFAFLGDAPGGNARLPRSYQGAPPRVPHSLDGLLPITREENWCLLCHGSGETGPDSPPQLPESHLIDWRSAPGVVRDEVAGARWVCTSCHVPQTDARALVGSSFNSRVR